MSAPLLGVDKEPLKSASTKGDIRNTNFLLELQLRGGVNIELIND